MLPPVAGGAGAGAAAATSSAADASTSPASFSLSCSNRSAAGQRDSASSRRPSWRSVSACQPRMQAWALAKMAWRSQAGQSTSPDVTGPCCHRLSPAAPGRDSSAASAAARRACFTAPAHCDIGSLQAGQWGFVW